MAKLRIIGGRFKGRQLDAPAGRGTRPTADRVREALFNILEHMDPLVLTGAVVLDLFAGTGALGLEALSRGAARVVFVEKDRNAQSIIVGNAQLLDVLDEIEVVRADATKLRSAPIAASLVFVDAPYGQDLVGPSLTNAATHGWIAAGATVIIEADVNEEVNLGADFVVSDERTYGGTKIVFAAYSSAPAE